MPWRPLPDPDGDPPVPVVAPLERVLAGLGAPPPATLARLFDSWSDIVGQAVASASTPLSLEHGMLLVAVRDGGWASQLRWMEPDLVAKIAAAVGEGLVERLEVRVRGS
jgi:predicted nucleic acid-binding Zn ribbon protein